MRWEEYGEDVGSATIVPDSPVVVDTPGMWKIIYRAGPIPENIAWAGNYYGYPHMMCIQFIIRKRKSSSAAVGTVRPQITCV